MGHRTPLFAWHQARGARIVDFGGWDMPVVYTSIGEEHHATRNRVGLFDISHMGRVDFSGPGAAALLERIVTNNVADLAMGQVRYALVLNDAAGALDDVLVYRRPDRHLLVVNASNREKILHWLEKQKSAFDATIVDQTFDTSMIAVQGPRAVALASELIGTDFSSLGRYHSTETFYAGAPALVSRTGYTGEDGVEVILPRELTEQLWTDLIDAAAAPVGLGARDTLRLEAGMPLYGHELTESIDPIQAGLGWAVKTKTKDFIGKAALATREPRRPVRVGLRLADKRIAREGFAITADGRPVGSVTSGTFSPTLSASIAMGYVEPLCATVGAPLQVKIRDAEARAEVVPLPFYRRSS